MSIHAISPALRRYGIAALVTALAISPSAALRPLCDHPFEVFGTAVAISAWYGGLGPGLLAAALSAVAADYVFVSVRALPTGTDPMMGAYVLAGELKEARGDHARAFARYERALRDVVTQEQRKVRANARILVPSTPMGLWVKTRVFPRLLPPLLVAMEHGRRLFPGSSSRPGRIKDYGNGLPPS
jgi:hypothetical protein